MHAACSNSKAVILIAGNINFARECNMLNEIATACGIVVQNMLHVHSMLYSPPRGSHRSQGDDPAELRSVRVPWSARESLYTPSAEPVPPLVPNTGLQKCSQRSGSFCVISQPRTARSCRKKQQQKKTTSEHLVQISK